MYRIGMSMFEMSFEEKSFNDLAKNEIFDVEISRPLYEHYENFDFCGVKKMAESHGINIWSLHFPFAPRELIDISAVEKEKRRKTVEYLSELIKMGGSIGVDKFVVHPSSEPISESERKEKLKCAKESLSKLADVAEIFNAVICVEDLPRTCLGNSADEMKFLTEEDERLRICFDTNHITADKPENVIRELKNKIVTLHVSDFDFVDEKHWIPGDGEINWSEVVKALKDIKYNGVWMYEVGFQSRSGELKLSDFKKNAEKILLA